MKPYETVSGEIAAAVHVTARMFVDEYKEANRMAKELGYKSLNEYLDAKIMDLVHWRLPQEHEDDTRKLGSVS